MLTCPNGHENLHTDQFCMRCGAALGVDVVAATKARTVARRKSKPQPSSEVRSSPVSTQVGSVDTSAALLPNLVAAILAGLGIFVGSFGPWVNFLAITSNGADINLRSGWGGTLTLGALSSAVLFTQLIAVRSRRTYWWLVPFVCAVPVCGLVTFIVSATLIVRLRSEPGSDFFGVPLGVQVGWGLWMVAAAAAVLCVTGWVVVLKVTNATEPGRPVLTAWTAFWASAAILSFVAAAGFTFVKWDSIVRPEADSIFALPVDRSPEMKSTSPEAEAPTTSSPRTTAPGTQQNGTLPKQIGETAAFTADGRVLLDFVVTDIKSGVCAGAVQDGPTNGALIAIDITARTHDDARVTNWDGLFGAQHWQVVSSQGITDPNVDTFNGFDCSTRRPPASFAVNSTYQFQIVLDSRFGAGAVIFRPIDASGWEWKIP